jgi:hypothetical protein
MLNDLLPNQMSNEDRLEVHPLYAKNNPKGNTPLANSLLESKPVNGSTVFESGNHNNENHSLFDPTTGMNWVVVDSSPVDLSTANINCASLETGDKGKYRLPSLSEFEELWSRYKNDERISVFKKREYITDSKNLVGSANYPQTFSFVLGNQGQPYQIRAAYLTCVSQ